MHVKHCCDGDLEFIASVNYLVFLGGIPVGPLDPVGEGPGVVVAAGGPPRVQRVYQRPVAVRTRPCTAKKHVDRQPYGLYCVSRK